MARVRNRDTQAEMAIRRELYGRGFRYRVNLRVPATGPARPDIAFTRQRVAVFVDGCFWHKCPEHATFPKSNAGWWAAKLDGNVTRDRAIDEALRQRGWKVVRIWEHEDAGDAVDTIVAVLDRSAPGDCELDS